MGNGRFHRAKVRVMYLLAAVSFFIADQASKVWAAKTLKSSEGRSIIPGILDLVYTTNNGIAFGQLQDSGAFVRSMLIVLGAAAGVAVVIFFLRTPRQDDRILGACALLLAGIAGNMMDRLRLGYVIDFIYFHVGHFNWPAFNLADASICCGVLLFAVDMISGGDKPRKSSRKRKKVVETA